MKYRKIQFTSGITLVLLSFLFIIVGCNKKKEFTIENQFLSRTIKIEGGKLRTIYLRNKLSGKELVPQNNVEFQLRISEGTHVENTDVILTSMDFMVRNVLKQTAEELVFLLINKKHGLQVEVHYELSAENYFLNKFLKIRAEKPITLERIDVESIKLDDIYQPYQIKQITAQGPAQWRPGLGQPLYTAKSALFLGTEFPAAYNFVKENTAYCGYLWGKELSPDEDYMTYKSVLGAGDDPDFIQDVFYNYIDQIRIRPLRLQIQYNSWFDYYQDVNKEKFTASTKKVNQELVTERNLPPLNAYVIDDGWQDTNADWSEKTWRVNQKFDVDFAFSKEAVKNANSNLGLWISPGCLFGAQPATRRYKAQGFEVLGNWMSMAGPKYMQLLEDRILELTNEGVTYFKLDGLFGHLNTREFELNGEKYGIPFMPQLGIDSLSPSDERLNDKKYDELKTYYLVAGTERLMQIFKNQNKLNPNVYVVISNGAWLSPWWLMYIDAVWMINAGDAAGGSNRTQELVYRDGVYYDTWVTEKTQFPINSVFNHEPKKTKTGESVQQFSEYLWMNLSRGTGFVELYIKTQNLSEADWDVMADGLKWAHKVFPYFKNARMHGGNPKKAEVYGYCGFNEDGGYASFHNPSEIEQKYIFKLNRKNGVSKNLTKLNLSSPLSNAKELSTKQTAFGNTLEITLKPGEVKIIEFNQVNR
jgi:hypothetical protein